MPFVTDLRDRVCNADLGPIDADFRVWVMYKIFGSFCRSLLQWNKVQKIWWLLSLRLKPWVEYSTGDFLPFVADLWGLLRPQSIFSTIIKSFMVVKEAKRLEAPE